MNYINKIKINSYDLMAPIGFIHNKKNTDNDISYKIVNNGKVISDSLYTFFLNKDTKTYKKTKKRKGKKKRKQTRKKTKL
jgi:hypothetical protein